MTLPCNKVIWAMSCVYQKDATVAAHSHEFYHYLYTKNGGGSVRIGEVEHPLVREHIYLFPPEVTHEIRAGDEGLIAYEIKFNIYDEKTNCELKALPEVICLSDSGAEQLLERIFNEMRNNEPLREEMIYVRFCELLLVLRRCNENTKSEKTSRLNFSARLAEVLFYMDEHFAEPMTLKQLSEIAHCEKIYFLKKFKSEIKETPMSYLRKLRIAEAKRLLEHSDMNITQICAAVGFPDIHHFSSTFKRMVGITPSEYKEHTVSIR